MAADGGPKGHGSRLAQAGGAAAVARALFTQPFAEAAKSLGVSERSLFRYASVSAVREWLDRLERRAFDEILPIAAPGAADAMRTLRELAVNADDPRIKVQAADKLL